MSSLSDGWKFEQVIWFQYQCWDLYLISFKLIGHSPVGASYIYPEGEFLCIVSKQYDRGTREDNNTCVSERVKVREKHQNFKKLNCFFLF
jgi:hypothetical protein